MRAIAKKKAIVILLAAIVGGVFIWWLFSPGGGAGDVDGGRMGDVEIRMERARTENERAAELNQRIEDQVGRLEERQRSIEAGAGATADVAERAEAVLEADRASLARGRAVIDAVEKRRIKKADEP